MITTKHQKSLCLGWNLLTTVSIQKLYYSCDVYCRIAMEQKTIDCTGTNVETFIIIISQFT